MYPHPRRFAALGSTLALLLQAPASHAEPTTPPSAAHFDITVGGGVGTEPRYSGASDHHAKFIPIVKVTYGHWFIGGEDTGAAVGYNFVQDQNWLLAAGVYADLSPRQQSDDPHLQGLGDVKTTARALLLAQYSQDWLKLGGTLTQDILGKHEGARAMLYARAKWDVNDQLTLFAGPRLAWANSAYMQTFYGVTAQQALDSGLAAYNASAGLQEATLDVGADYRIDAHWGVGARFSFGKLHGSAADSPITEKTNQTRFGAFAAYHF
ncbi:MipA/OmpV family protein [Amantichitinum ursilacus]|uniref:MltA-interacting protein MipA n=1 Tax=Amantichitinum ursilacus TaxID=857265 RepID=A0A0N0XG27_9NEIS|nr:MipA/OmpV family protein [Amantichitinum ursilacus]KPC49623.1 MltA-interacting protein MipA [Amantichitinum ursilacus]